MRTTLRSILFLLLLSAAPITSRAAEPAATAPTSDWITLFNGRDLSNWDKFLVPPGSKEPMVANMDPQGVFTVAETDGESAIHVSGEHYGAITTRAQFTNFHFRVQFKWGLARWGGRARVGRDSGILTSANGITPPFDVESVFGNWNTAEVVFWGGNCIHILNGRVNLVAFNPRYREGDQWIPLTQGKIQLQSEGGEVFYRKAEARPLHELPAELLEQVVSPVGGEDGFVPLLGEAALPAWKQCGPGKFAVADGVATGEGGMGLWWYSGKTFTNFVLRGEFLQEQEIADSGVFLRFPDPGQDPWRAVKEGHEMEIGDPKPANPTWRTGSIYPFHASVMAQTEPVGQWNSYEIVCRGHNYSVRMNGKMVNTWTDTTQRASRGFIGLQNYNDGKTVRHRHLRVKELL